MYNCSKGCYCTTIIYSIIILFILNNPFVGTMLGFDIRFYIFDL